MKICPECRTTFHEAAPICPNDGASLLDLRDDDARCGTVIDDRFLILSQLGEGGMGTVYRAWQFSTGRMVALKLLIAAFSTNKTAVERFMREARVTAGLNSPHVVRIYDFGQLEDGTAYMAMELVEGVPLEALIDGPMPPERAMELVRQICIALEEAHGQGLVHRDLKPGNIMVRQLADGGDFAQVLDFGIAKILDETRTALTAENQNPGTPAYMSPEQARNETIGPPTDLYALSVMFFEMLVGERPFTGTSAMSVLLQHVQAAPPRLTERLPDLPRVAAIDAVLQRGLAKDATTRYGTAAALRTELDRLKSGVDPEALTDPANPVVKQEKRRFGFNMQALGCSVQLAVAVGALALFVLPAMRDDASDRFDTPGETAGRFETKAADDKAPASTPPEAPKETEARHDTEAMLDTEAKRDIESDEEVAATEIAKKRSVTPADSKPIAGFAAVDDEGGRDKADPRSAPPRSGGAPPPPTPPPGATPKKSLVKAKRAKPAPEKNSMSARVSGSAGGKIEREGGASEADLRRGLLALQPKLRAQCGAGRWPVEVLVDIEGRVQRARITQPGRAAHAQAKCALKLIRGVTLPKPAEPVPLTLTL